jgi:hypothetical protein
MEVFPDISYAEGVAHGEPKEVQVVGEEIMSLTGERLTFTTS